MAKALINKILLFGVQQVQELSLEDVMANRISVKPLQTFINGTAVREDLDDSYYEHWCYPDGIRITSLDGVVLNDKQPQYSFRFEDELRLFKQGEQDDHTPKDYLHSFVHTDYQLKRTYAVCLSFNELIHIKQRKGNGNENGNENNYNSNSKGNIGSPLPKCLLSNLHSTPPDNMTAVYIPKCLVLFSEEPCFKLMRNLLKWWYRNGVAKTQGVVVAAKQIERWNEIVQREGYWRAEIIYDKDMPLPGETDQFKIRTYNELSKGPLLKFFTSMIGFISLGKQPAILKMVDTPTSSIVFPAFVSHPSLTFKAPDVDTWGAINLLGRKMLLSLWKCAVLQKQIIIFGHSNYVIQSIFQTMLFLIQPLMWQNVYIPFLPFHLHHHVDSPGGLMIGMAHIHMNYMIENYNLTGKVIVDIENGIIIEEGGKGIVEMPSKIFDWMNDRLKAIGVQEKWNGGGIDGDLRKLFELKRVFFDGLLYLLNNYRPFASLKDNSCLQFKKNDYINMFKGDSTAVVFATQLCKTMVFTRLCQYHLMEEKKLRWNQQTIGGIFVYCMNMLQAITNKVDKQIGNEDGNGIGNDHPSSIRLWQVPPIISSQAPSFINNLKSKKKDIKYAQTPYNAYYTYAMKKSIDSLNESTMYISVQHYLIKYLSWVEWYRPGHLMKSLPRVSNTGEGWASTILKYLIPWKYQSIKKEEGKIITLNYDTLLNLGGLFSQMQSKQVILTQSQYYLKKYNQIKYMKEKNYDQLLRQRMSI